MTERAAWQGLVIAAMLSSAVATAFAQAEPKQQTPKQLWEAKLAALKKAGEPVSFKSLAPPKVPDEENAAEVYAEAWDAWDDVPEPARRQMDDLNGRREPWDDADMALARDLLNEAEEVIDLLKKAAAMKRCRFPIDYDGPAYAVLLPHLRRMQQMARVMSFSARTHLVEGKAKDAVDDCVTLLRMSRATRGQSILITRLVEIAVASMAHKRLQQVMDKLELPDGVLRKLERELADFDDRKPFVRSMQGERCMGIDLVTQMAKDPTVLQRVMGKKPTLGDRLKAMFARPMVHAMGVRYLAVMGKYVVYAGKPWHEVKEKVAEVDEEIRKAKRDPNNALVAALTPALGKAAKANDAGIARGGCARIAVALRRFRLKHKRYPDKLAALVPEFLKKLPKDPFSGRDYVYRREGKGFVVYSVGGNGIDDDGDDQRATDLGDIAWKCSR